MDSIEIESFLAHSKLPQFKRKLLKTKEILQKAFAITDNAYCAISWGKDSIVMLHLIQQIKPTIKAINIGDKLENKQNNYQETINAYMQRFPTNYQAIYYEEETEGGFYPQIRKIAKEYELAFIGCRREESKYRAIVISKYGTIHKYKSGSYRCFPLAYWNVKDIWAYLFKYDLPYLNSYDLQGYESRTAVIHNFDLHRGKHQETLIRYGAFAELKLQCPEYYNLYADLYPEIRNYG
jgi:phosphoadenosine phosphosulfate reductase